PEDGRISWLRNPGEPDARWEVRHVGDLVATHRMRLGSFTGKATLELLALPVVGPSGGADALHAPIRTTIFRPPGDLLAAAAWESEVADESSFRIIHGVALERQASGRDRLLLASE